MSKLKKSYAWLQLSESAQHAIEDVLPALDLIMVEYLGSVQKAKIEQLRVQVEELIENLNAFWPRAGIAPPPFSRIRDHIRQGVGAELAVSQWGPYSVEINP